MASMQVRDANGAVTYMNEAAGAGTSGSPYTPAVAPHDGTNQILSASAANLAATTTANALLVSRPGQWTQTHAPAVNTVATKSQAAAGTGIRNVCQWLTITLANNNTGSVQTLITFHLRDGATGAGTILASFTLALPATAGECRVLTLTGLNIPGTANTAMTLESAAAPAAQTAASVAFGGCLAA